MLKMVNSRTHLLPIIYSCIVAFHNYTLLQILSLIICCHAKMSDRLIWNKLIARESFDILYYIIMMKWSARNYLTACWSWKWWPFSRGGIEIDSAANHCRPTVYIKKSEGRRKASYTPRGIRDDRWLIVHRISAAHLWAKLPAAPCDNLKSWGSFRRYTCTRRVCIYTCACVRVRV